MKKKHFPRNWDTTKYTKPVKVSEDNYLWIMENKGKKTRAGFLDQIIEEYRKPNLFKNGNKQNKKNKD